MLLSGEDVATKVQRPGIASQVERDLDIDALLDLSHSDDPVDTGALDRALAQLLTRRLGAGQAAGAEMLGDLLALIVRFSLALDPQLAAMFRALATLDGTLRTLDPAFDILQEAQQLAAAQAIGLPTPAGLTSSAADDLLELLPELRRIPRRLDQLGRLAERGELTLRIRPFADHRGAEHAGRLVDRLILAFLSASIGLVSVLLLPISAGPVVAGPTRLTQLLGYAGLTAATILGLRVLATLGRYHTRTTILPGRASGRCAPEVAVTYEWLPASSTSSC